MMDDEIDVFFTDSGSTCYLESLIRSRVLLSKITEEIDLIDKLNYLISLELDLAVVGAEKAMSEVKKATVTPLKGV